MSNIDLDAILAQRAEATGAEDGRVPFTFKGETFTFRDPMTLDDDAQDELEDLATDGRLSDVAMFWMGEKEWDRFAEAGGTAMMFRFIVEEHAAREESVDRQGNPSQRSRSQRRAAARKR